MYYNSSAFKKFVKNCCIYNSLNRYRLLVRKGGIFLNCEFPKILSNLRKSRGISQKQAAIDLGVSQALLSHYEKGIRECGLDFLVQLSKYYDVSCDELLGVERKTKSQLPKEMVQNLNKLVKDAEKLLSNSEK